MEARSRRLDNRGMTLVELLIAITILAIITVPLLHAFISAASVNMNSRKKLRITTTAQDVMEGLRADDLEELALQIYYPAGIVEGITGNVIRDGFRIIDRNLVKGSMSENRCVIAADGSVSGFSSVSDTAVSDDDKPCISSTDGGVTYKFNNKPGGKYYFYLQDVTVETGGTSNYFVDVLMKVDATPYRTGGTVSPNSIPLVDISDMNDSKDVVFELKESDLLSAINGANSTTYSMQDMVMDIDVEIDKNNVGGTDEFITRMNYKMYAKAHPAHNKSETMQATRSELRNVFLFYNPTYNGKNNFAAATPDSITFKNNDLVDNTFYIVRQYDGSLSNIGTWEENYRCNVNIIGEMLTDTKPHTMIRTNLDYSLKDIMLNAAAGGDGTYSELPTHQATYKYNGINMTSDERNAIVNNMGGESYSVVDPMSGDKFNDRLYDVDIYVYDKGSIAEAKTNGGNISSDKLLVTLDGTIR